MADEVKEGLTQEADVEASNNDSTEENVEDYFNPFADISDEDKEIEKDIKQEQEDDDGDDEDEQKKVEKPQPVESDVRNELAEVKAERQASKEVSTFIKDNPEFEEMSESLVDLASKATVRGHSKPLEFALRNVKPPSYWIDYGKKLGREDLQSVSQNRVGGTSMPKSGKGGTPDFNSMSQEEFNEYSRQVMSRT